MSQNPFEALGGGGFDMNALLQQAQLADTVVDGTVAGGAVTVQVNGVGELVGVEIKAGGFDGDNADDLSDLGDMIVAAYRDAKAQADALAGETLGPIAGGLPGGDQPGGPAGGLPGLGQ